MTSSPADFAPFDFRGKNVLIFIVAYNAARTIEKVLSRIPASQEGWRFLHNRRPQSYTDLVR